MHYPGVDVSKASLDLDDGEGRHRRFSNDPAGIAGLVSWLERRFPTEEVRVVLEPTSTYHQLLVSGLATSGIPFTVVNPLRAKRFAETLGLRAKTDRVDARTLSRLGRALGADLKPSTPPDEAQERFRSLRRHMEWMGDEVQAARNRLEAASHSPWTPQQVLESLRRMIGDLEREKAAVERQLEEWVDGDELLSSQVRLLETVPGVGRRTAVLLLSELPRAQSCKSARSWVAWAGVCPEERQSGRSAWSRLSRVGSSRLRARLYMAAVAAMKSNPAVSEAVQRLGNRGRRGRMVVMAAMNRLLRICFGVVRHMRPFDPEAHRQHQPA